MNFYIIQNPDKKIVSQVKEALKSNDGYCPCSLFRDADHKCMCKEFRERNSEGECHCGLYIKFEKDGEI